VLWKSNKERRARKKKAVADVLMAALRYSKIYKKLLQTTTNGRKTRNKSRFLARLRTQSTMQRLAIQRNTDYDFT